MTADLDFSTAQWRSLFAANGWREFEDLWSLQGSEVEPGNVRRGGWSSVVRFEAADGTAFYLKRQENHDYRHWQGGLKRTPTVAREWQVGVDFRASGIGTAEPVCLGVLQAESSRGLLVTRALDDFDALPEVLQRLPDNSAPRQALWYQIADEVRRIHDLGFRHNCLYAQHILIRERQNGPDRPENPAAPDWECAFIDLEKATLTRRRDRAVIADLSALDRHTEDMSQRDRQWFWDRYFSTVALPERRKVLRVLARRTAARGVDSYIRDCAKGRRGELARGPAD